MDNFILLPFLFLKFSYTIPYSFRSLSTLTFNFLVNVFGCKLSISNKFKSSVAVPSHTGQLSFTIFAIDCNKGSTVDDITSVSASISFHNNVSLSNSNKIFGLVGHVLQRQL